MYWRNSFKVGIENSENCFLVGKEFEYNFVLLDANTIYGELTRDILLSLATKRLFSPLWSDRILDEVEINLRENLGIDFKNARQKMEKAFPRACVKDFEELESEITFPDENDIHILAVAKKSAANLIITEDQDFVPENLLKYNLEAMKIDLFLKRVLNFYGYIALDIIDNMRERRNKFELLSKLKFINRLKEIGLKETAKTIELLYY